MSEVKPIEFIFLVADIAADKVRIPDNLWNDALDKARAELDALQRDSERLKWILSQSTMEGNIAQQPSGNVEYIFRHTRRNGLPVIFQEESPFITIDAAMEADK